MSKSALYKMFDRKSEPKLETFFAIIEGLNISLEDFVHPDAKDRKLSATEMQLIQSVKGFDKEAIERVIAYAEFNKTKQEKRKRE